LVSQYWNNLAKLCCIERNSSLTFNIVRSKCDRSLDERASKLWDFAHPCGAKRIAVSIGKHLDMVWVFIDRL
jgi:hypothetical protein